jgi:hypothetical protein
MKKILHRVWAVAALTLAINADAQRPTRADSVVTARRLIAVCGTRVGEKRTQCFRDSLTATARSGAVAAAVATLAVLTRDDPAIRRDDHLYAHSIGISAGASGRPVAEVFTQCTVAFQSGCYHGVIESYFDRVRTVDSGAVTRLCTPFRTDPAKRWILFQCVHGMGHGLTMYFKHDLRRSLKSCDLLPNDWEQHSCYGGAFMENIVNATMPQHPSHGLGGGGDEHMGHTMSHESAAKPFLAIDPKDHLYPCSKMAERYLPACYEMQTSVMLYLNGGSVGAAAHTCETAPPAMRSLCHQSLGRDVSSRTGQDYQTSIRLCSFSAERFRPWCFVGLVKNFIDLNGRYSDGMRFCAVLLTHADKLKCYEAVGEQISALVPTDEGRRAACATGEKGYVAACLYGARTTSTVPPGLATVNAAAQR